MTSSKRPAQHHHSLAALARLLPLGSPRSWAFLAGAGISVPSGLPTAWEFNERIATFLSNSTRQRRQIRTLLTTDSSRVRNRLRFEQVIEILREIAGDKELGVLNEFDDPGPPSELHFLLARMLRRGAAVMTTNFDNLIEYACLTINRYGTRRMRQLLQIHLESERSGRSRSSFRWYAMQRRLQPAVLKLHGSLRTLTTDALRGTVLSSDRTATTSIGATLDALGRAAGAPGLELMKEKVLRRVIRDRTLCVMGYSGSDDFDVLPSLARMAATIEKVVWIRHAHGPIRIHSDLAAISRLPGLLAKHCWPGRVFVIEGNTLSIVRSLFGAERTRVPMRVVAPRHTRVTSFETFSPYAGMTASRKLMLFAYLQESALNFRAAQHTYIQAVQKAKRERDVRSEVFSLARLGQLTRVRGRLAQATRYLGRAQKKLIHSSADHRLAATVFLAAGNVALDQAAWATANEVYRKAIAHARRVRWMSMEATALNNLGLVYRRQGRMTLAKRYIIRALKVDRRLRRRSGIARELGNLGIIAHEQGNYREALKYGKQALTLDRDMGSNATLTTKQVDVVFALIRLRRYIEAKKELKSAFRLAIKYERPEDEARCWSARGLLYSEWGQFRRSISCHERALNIVRALGRRETIAHELFELGNVYTAVDAKSKARQCFREALLIFRAIGNDPMTRIVKRSLAP